MEHPSNDTPEKQCDPRVSAASEPPRKRRKRRKVACRTCRDRKLRCDLAYPVCGRCAKSDGAAACHYEDPPSWWQQHQQQPSAYSVSLEQPHQRTSKVSVPGLPGQVLSANQSAVLNAQSHQPTIQPDSGIITACEPQHACRQYFQSGGSSLESHTCAIQETRTTCRGHPKHIVPNKALLGGKEHKTRFFGCSNVTNLMSEFSELKTYLNAARENHPILSRVHRDIASIKHANPERHKSSELSLDAAFLRSLLPPRSLVERLVTTYFTSVGSIHRVLHRQTFYERLHQIWNPISEVAAPFIIQLYLVMAIVWNVDDPEDSTGSDGLSLSSTTAKSYIHWADAWLSHSDEKRPSLTVLQTRCLLLLAKQANYTQKNQAWSSAGTLVKMAMSAGYHRIPEPNAPISVFNREMRRRIWATVLELDLEASLDRGMPPTVQQYDYDYDPPSHIDDQDIQEDSTDVPIERPFDTVTDTSFQTMAYRSIALRLRICALVNAPRFSMSLNEMASFDDAIVHHIADIPDWPAFATENEKQRQPLLLRYIVLQTNLRRCQLSLYGSCTLSGLKGSIYTNSRRASLDIATLILCQQQLLLHRVGKLAWCALTDVTFQAAVTICHFLYTSCSNPVCSVIQRVIPSLSSSLISLVEDSLPALEQKFAVLGKGMREYCFLSMIIAIVKTKYMPEKAASNEKQFVDRSVSACYSIISRNGNPTSDKPATGSKRALGDPTYQNRPVSPFSGLPPMGQARMQGTGSNDASLLGEWDFLLGDIETIFPALDDIY